MWRGLAGRIAIGGVLIALLFLVQLGLTLQSLHSIRHHTRSEQRGEQAIVAAVRLEQHMFDLSAAARGYVISRDPSFLATWRQARAALPAESRKLAAVSSRGDAARIEAAWRAYVDDYSAPLVRASPANARARIATLEGVHRLAAVRAVIDPFVDDRNDSVTRDRKQVEHDEHLAFVVDTVGAVVRILIFVGILLYVLRAIVWPLRGIANATQRVTAGEIGVVVPERGAGEVGQLAGAFNEMSRTLSSREHELGEQNVDLERLANVLRAVLDSTVDGILLTDVDGNVQLANRPLVHMTRDLGMSFDGTVVDRLLSVADRMGDRDAYRAAMERLRANPNESTFNEFEDTVSGRVFQGFTAPVLDDRGGFLGRVWTLREVTQQRELDRLKDEFVATVSHELRTPLTSMMGFLEMIREGEAGQLTEEQKRFLAIVYRSSERLQRLVGDLLFVARLDANGLQLQFAEVRVEDVAQDIVESNAALARSRELTLQAELGDVPAVWADRERLAQLLGNLVSNAIKFTPPSGTITVRTFERDSEAVIEVEDTGIGIPEGEQERLFQRFFRSSTATEQAIPGTGLGLVISKAIAEAHGGGMEVRSEAGVGTCFSVHLPLEPEAVAA
jgi:signal transduction histidine kinase